MFLAIRKIVVHLHVAIFSGVCLVNRSAVGDSWWLLRGSKEGLCIERIGKCAEQPGTHGAPAAESELYNPRLSKDIPYSIISFYLQKKKRFENTAICLNSGRENAHLYTRTSRHGGVMFWAHKDTSRVRLELKYP